MGDNFFSFNFIINILLALFASLTILELGRSRSPAISYQISLAIVEIPDESQTVTRTIESNFTLDIPRHAQPRSREY